MVQKIVLSSNREQGNFRGLEALKLKPRTWPSRPRPKPRTSKCVLEAKEVLEDSTFVVYRLFIYCSRLERNARRKREELWRKKFAVVANFFSRSRAFDWFDWTYSQREWTEKKKKSRWLNKSAYSTKINRKKKNKTDSFQSTNNESMVCRL